MPTTYAPGIRPLYITTAWPRIDCPDNRTLCAWGYHHHSFGPGNIDGYFILKFVNMGCRLHSKKAHTAIPVQVNYGVRYRPNHRTRDRNRPVSSRR